MSYKSKTSVHTFLFFHRNHHPILYYKGRSKWALFVLALNNLYITLNNLYITYIYPPPPPLDIWNPSFSNIVVSLRD